MIRFNCNCTNEFLVDEDQAGGLIQCPKCGRLNDIPTLSDAQNLEDGGIYKMDAKPTGPKKNVLPSATRAFTKEHVDDSGDEIDLRQSVDEFLAIGVPTGDAAKPEAPMPKYDPLTGELVAEIDIKPDNSPKGTDLHSIPIAKRAVAYATPDISPRITPANILLHLFQPVNLFVMMFVVLAHVLWQLALRVCLSGMVFVIVALFIITFLIVAHYGTIIDEIGPEQADELPRPLRNLSWSEDLWGPFIRFGEAIMFCFGPSIIIISFMGHSLAGAGLAITCFVFGIYFFPAVLLTTQTGGTTLNLRFDRVVGVIRACGAAYWVSILAFAIAFPIYIAGTGGVAWSFDLLFQSQRTASANWFVVGLIFSPVLLLGIYLFHFACWHLGLLYRANSPRFPWVLQRHTFTHRTDMLAQLEAARAASRLAVLQKNKPDRDARIAEIRTTEQAKKAANADNRQIWDRVAD